MARYSGGDGDGDAALHLNELSHMIVGWITDFTFYCASSLFEADKLIDNIAGTKRMIAMCLETQEDSLPECYRLQHRVLQLIHVLDFDHGSRHWMDEVADAFNKVIELLDDSPATRDDIRAAAINIKTEAVYALCRQNSFEEAEEVFSRVWGKCSTHLGKQKRKTVLSVLKSRDPFHGALQVPAPFKEMLTSIKSILQHARRKLKRPFLVQAAEETWVRTKRVDDEAAEEDADDAVHPKTGLILEGRLLDEVRKHYGLKKSLHTNKKACLERIKEIRKNKDAFIASMPDVVKYGPKSNSNSISDIEDTRTQDNATSAGKTSPSMTSTPKRSHSLTSTPRKRAPSLTSTPVKRKRRKAPTDTAVWVMSDGTRRNGDVSNRTNLEKNENEEDNSSTSTASEDIFAQPAPLVLGPQLRFRHSLAPDNVSVANTTTSSRVRSRWLPSEEELLFQGVVNFGTGQWVLIKKKYDFWGRTNVDLKDKWRNMKKNGRVEELREVFDQQ